VRLFLFTTNAMQLTSYERRVRNILMDVTGYTFNKETDDEGTYYNLIDLYGDVDGDPFYEFDDLIDYISNNSDVKGEISNMQALVTA